MMRFVVGLAVMMSAQIAGVSTLSAQESTSADANAGLGKVIAPFVLPDFRGEKHDLSRLEQPVVVVVFLGVGCPLAQLYGPRLQSIADEFGADDVAVLGVNSNRQDAPSEIAAYVRKLELRFPLLKDAGNRVADQFGAIRTPEAFVLDRSRTIRYRGRIDDQYGVGYSRDHAERHELKDAVAAVLDGRPVKTPLAEAVGCHIGRIAAPDNDSEVTYSNQISRIMQRHCVECHRAGEIAPFELTDYEQVVGWGQTIDEVIQDHRMPPWHADPKFGKFRNARRMTDAEKKLISQWVEAGAPQGDPKQLPVPIVFPKSAWRTSKEPDLVVAMREKPFRVPADGTVEYQYFVVDPKLTEDKWISSAEVIPGNRRVVHHAIVFIKPPKADDLRGFGLLTAYVPGQSMLELPKGTARKLPAGSKLIFQMHYTPAGAAQDDLTRAGLVFADPKTVKQEAFTMLMLNRDFEIPPHAENHKVSTTLDEFPEGSRLLAVAPHMHVRGKSFRFVVQNLGRQETALFVPHYDFNWQHSYGFEKPLELHAGMKLECIGTFDNSAANLVNPDPTMEVRWGDQTWEEMMLGYLEIAAPLKLTQPTGQKRRLAAAEEAADDFIDRFDKDRDGVVAIRETPSAFSTFAFRRIDANGDKLISREEAIREAMNRKRQR